MTPFEGHTLSLYNAEKERGLLHTDTWKEQMAELQEAYDKLTLEEQKRLFDNALPYIPKYQDEEINVS